MKAKSVVLLTLLMALLVGCGQAEEPKPTGPGWIGVLVGDMAPAVREFYQLSGEQGVVVLAVVVGSSAEAAGLRPGDLIIQVDGISVPSAALGLKQIQQKSAGQSVTLTVGRGGQQQQITVAVRARPGDEAVAKMSEQAFSKLIEADPKNYIAYWQRALNRGLAGNMDEAIADFTQAIALKSDFAEAYLGRGWAYINKAQPENALPDESRAIELDPEDPVAYLYRGVAHKMLGHRREAIADLERVIVLGGNLEAVQEARKALAELK